MKRSLPKSLTAAIILIALASLLMVSRPRSVPGHPAASAPDRIVEALPAALPADHHFNRCKNSNVHRSWRDALAYYREDVLSEKDRTWFPVLQWEALSYLVEQTRLLYEASPETLLFIVRELEGRTYYPDPELVYAVAAELPLHDTTVIVPVFNLAEAVPFRNLEYLGEEEYGRHLESNVAAYRRLEQFGDAILAADQTPFPHGE